MLNWHYNPANYNAEGYQLIPPGEYRVRIEDAEETESKTGKPMIKMTLKVSGYNSKIWNYVVLDNTSEKAIAMTDNNLGRIYDSFNIPQGNLNLQDWKGKVGAAEIKNELDNKEVMRAGVKYFIQRKKQDTLPAWQENPTVKVNAEMADFESDLPPF
ncbi:MAG: DUF669 domain-containing protein [Synergistaceae bacterium]|nr:DUF669 domain-containing protein [Synergistaceae bacterium]